MSEDKKKVLIALGSPSDMELLKNAKLPEDIDFYLSVASAHRTPELVEMHHAQCEWDAVIACAGLTNALASKFLTLVPSNVPVIAVPIYDKATRGLASVMSTTELPPGYPIFTTKIGDMNQAIEFYNRAKNLSGDEVNVVYWCTHYAPDNWKENKLGKALDSFGIKYKQHDMHLALPNDLKSAELSGLVLLVTEDPSTEGCSEPVSDAKMPVVVESSSNLSTNLAPIQKYRYMRVSTNSPTNLAVAAAKLLARNNPDVKAELNKYLAAGRAKYDPYDELIELTPEKIEELTKVK